MLPDVNTIHAGEYELVALRWDQQVGLEPIWNAAQGRAVDQPKYVRRHRGDLVQLDTGEARRLLTSGAVRRPVDPAALERLAQAHAALQDSLLSVPVDLHPAVQR